MELSIRLLPVAGVLTHEDTIPSLVEILKADMKRTGVQRDPLIIDRKTHLALDGMHRRLSLESLGARFVVCAEFDYLSESIKLDRWFRYLIAPGSRLIQQIVSEFGMIPCRSLKKATLMVDTLKAGFALLSREESYVSLNEVITKRRELVESTFDMVRKFDALCIAGDALPDVIADGEIDELFASQSVFVLYSTLLRKSDVLASANSRYQFPFKTTRHILPLRPMGLNFPLNSLCDSTEKECSLILRSIIRNCKVNVEKKDIWYEGRRYNEPLAIFRHQVN
ncbi:MAG: ParB N-terminal domain-containing protein [Nitrososphaerales archaeon]